MREEDIKYIHELEKRVYELEETIEKQKHEIERYREYLELIRIIGTHGTNIESREVIMSDEASLADEALFIDGGNIYTNTITANQIASRTITANQITAGTITANEIKTKTTSADCLNIDSLSATLQKNYRDFTVGELLDMGLKLEVITHELSADEARQLLGKFEGTKRSTHQVNKNLKTIRAWKGKFSIKCFIPEIK